MKMHVRAYHGVSVHAYSFENKIKAKANEFAEETKEALSEAAEKAVDLAEEAAEEGIRIFTIGVGDLKGGPIPEKRNGIVLNYKKDSEGETVITKLNEETLKGIAQEANGAYINGKNTNDVVENIRENKDIEV